MSGAVDTPDERLREYRRLFETALEHRERRADGVAFTFRADPGTREAVEELARREAACCRSSATGSRPPAKRSRGRSAAGRRGRRPLLRRALRAAGRRFRAHHGAARGARPAVRRASPEIRGHPLHPPDVRGARRSRTLMHADDRGSSHRRRAGLHPRTAVAAAGRAGALAAPYPRRGAPRPRRVGARRVGRGAAQRRAGDPARRDPQHARADPVAPVRLRLPAGGERPAALAVAVARAQRGVALPPIAVVAVGDAYAVRDGHHRVSVARARGALAIDAIVDRVASAHGLGSQRGTCAA